MAAGGPQNASETMKTLLRRGTTLAAGLLAITAQTLTAETVTGVVHRPDGKPAAGLPIQIVGDFGAEKKRQTDAEGRFSFEFDRSRFGDNSRTFCLLIRDPERNLAIAQDLEEDGGALDLKLAPGMTLVGSAVCDGKPLPNACAALVFWTGNSGMHLPGLCVKTNIAGHFEIPALPPGRRYGLYVTAPGYGQKYVNVTETAEAERVETDATELKPANLKLAGKVVDEDDKPVENAYVNLNGEGQPSGSARTDKEGRFRFEHVCQGEVRLFANARNAHANISAEAGDTNVIVKLGTVSPSYGGAEMHKLTGVVNDPDGKPVAGAQLQVFPSSGPSNITKTSANGTFNLTWGLQPWQLQNGGSAMLVIRDTAQNLAAAEDLSEDVTNTTVQLKACPKITGRVEGEDGKPIVGAEVGVWLLAARTYNQVDDRLAQAGSDGKFEIKALPSGPDYMIFARAKGYSRVRLNTSIEPDIKWMELEPFVLRVADKVISGQVVDAKEKPVSGANVSISGDNQPEENVTTDPKGRFTFKVCEGSVQLYASGSRGYSNTSAEAGDTNVVIQLGDGGSTERVVVRRASLNGKPLPALAELGIAADATPTGKPVLLCLVDIEQRPSRHLAKLLAEQQAALKEKGVTVVALQAAVADPETLKGWQTASAVPFPVGSVPDKSPKTRWATDAESLPWLILADGSGRVVAEGFEVDELSDNLKRVLK